MPTSNDIAILDIQSSSLMISVNTYTPPALSRRLPAHTMIYFNACQPAPFSLDEKTQFLPSKKLVIPPEILPITLAAKNHSSNCLPIKVTPKSTPVEISDEAWAFKKVRITVMSGCSGS